MAWIIQDGELTNTEFIALPARPFVGDSPYTMWRINPDINNGMPYSPLMIGVPVLPLYIEPARPLIHVYDSQATTYNGNGYAIIEPISANIRQEENGMYEVTFETFLDKYNKYLYLKRQAQVKIPLRYHGETIYQIFRIRQVNRRMDSNGNYRIIAIAQHKWYDLARYMIEDCRPTAQTGTGALDWLMTHGWYDNKHQIQEFDYSSNIGAVSTAYYENVNVASAILGVDQCFVNRWGGKLYRDNNYFSINYSMEYAQSSGVIEYSYNMTEIDWQEDDSALITILIAKDNFGNEWRITNPDVPNENIPHHIYGYAFFSYDTENVAQFHTDAQAYFDEYKQAQLSIKVQFANLADIEKYKDFLALDDFEVGDKITIYHKELGIYYSNLEVISKEFDAVAQKTMQIELGNFKNAITRRPFMSGTISSGDTPANKEIIAINTQLNDMALRALRTWGGASAYRWGEVEKYTWEDVTKYVYNND